MRSRMREWQYQFVMPLLINVTVTEDTEDFAHSAAEEAAGEVVGSVAMVLANAGLRDEVAFANDFLHDETEIVSVGYLAVEP